MAKGSDAIRDFFVKMGFDGEDVFKGLKSIDKEFDKFNKTFKKNVSVQAKAGKAQAKVNKDQEKSLSRQTALERKRLAIRKKIQALKDVGGDPRALGSHNSLRSNNLEKLKQAELRLDEALHLSKIAQNKENAKALRLKEKERKVAETIAKQESMAAKSRKKAQEFSNSQTAIERSRNKHIESNRKALDAQRRAAIQSNKDALKAQKKLYENEARAERRRDSLSARRTSSASSIDKITRRLDKSVNTDGMPSGEGAVEHARLMRTRSQLMSRVGTAQSSKDFAQLRREIAKLNDETTTFVQKNRQVQRELNRSSLAAQGVRDSLRNLARSYASVFAVIGGGAAGTNIGQNLVSIKASFLAATGSAEAAGEAFEFVKNASLNMGLNLESSAKNFSHISLAAKNAGISVDDTRSLFLGLSEASAAFGMSTVDQERAFRSITQMMSKGQIMAEELKSQLSESLPATIQIAAKAMGVLPKELFKMMERGELMADEFLPKFTKELRKAVREGGALEAGLNTSRVAMARFGTAFKLNVLDSFESGLDSGMGDFFNALTQWVEQSTPLFTVLGKVFGVLLDTIGTGVLAMTQLTVRPILLLLKELSDETTFLGGMLAGLAEEAKRTAGHILLPFAELERFYNDVEEKGLVSALTRDDNTPAENFMVKWAEDITKSILNTYFLPSGVDLNNVTPRQNVNNVNIQIDGAQNPEVVGSIVEKKLEGIFTLGKAPGGL